MKIVTLTTDFGQRDWFVGAMKGAILAIDSGAKIVDITHEIPAGDIRAGAFALAAGCRFFPKGTVHAAVVDPGVGTQRRAIAVKTTNYCFVGPDNGVLSLALAQEKVVTIRCLENEKYFLSPISTTFHGRDIFAPVAAHLSKGVDIKKLGPAIDSFVQLPWPGVVTRPGVVEGEVIFIDRFGNAITNIRNEVVERGKGYRCKLVVRRNLSCPIAQYYQAVPIGNAVCVPGSAGFLEIAINGGSAAEVLGLRVGKPVALRFG